VAIGCLVDFVEDFVKVRVGLHGDVLLGLHLAGSLISPLIVSHFVPPLHRTHQLCCQYCDLAPYPEPLAKYVFISKILPSSLPERIMCTDKREGI
jgi:hypothetical protein